LQRNPHRRDPDFPEPALPLLPDQIGALSYLEAPPPRYPQRPNMSAFEVRSLGFSP
jgi:hypothetical protein